VSRFLETAMLLDASTKDAAGSRDISGEVFMRTGPLREGCA